MPRGCRIANIRSLSPTTSQIQTDTKAETDKATVDEHVAAELTKAKDALGAKMYAPSAVPRGAPALHFPPHPALARVCRPLDTGCVVAGERRAHRDPFRRCRRFVVREG